MFEGEQKAKTDIVLAADFNKLPWGMNWSASSRGTFCRGTYWKCTRLRDPDLTPATAHDTGSERRFSKAQRADVVVNDEMARGEE